MENLKTVIVILLAAALTVLAQPKQSVEVITINSKTGVTFTVEKAPGIDPRYYPLMRRLGTEGYSDEALRKCFADERTVFVPRGAYLKTTSKPAPEKYSYSWVDTDESAAACMAFVKKYRKSLDHAQKVYGVEPETVAALMRCETRHGAITGDYHLFSTFASMALQNDSTYLDSSLTQAYKDLAAEGADSATIAGKITALKERAQKRGKWAYKELGNCLKMYQKDTAMLGIYGSWAGAFGWCQFLPSSYLRSAVDGNGDHRVNLFNPSDAIHSVANYLRNAGYKSGDTARMRRALFNYNNSTAYVESILDLAGRVNRKLFPPAPAVPPVAPRTVTPPAAGKEPGAQPGQSGK